MTSFYPSAASSSASGTPSYVSPANEAAAFLSSSRVRTGATDFRILPEAKRPRSSASHSRPALSSSARCLPAMTGPRPAATSSSAQDWVNAALPPTPALQTCTYDPASAQVQASAAHVSYRKHDAPLAPALDPRFAHCPTPELTPPEDAMAVDGPAAAAAISSSRSRQPAPSSSSTFIKRDDLTAKAIARAASMSMPAQPTLPHKQYSLGSESSSSASAQPSEKDRLVNSLVGASILAIESIWGQTVSSPDCSMAVKAGGDSVIPLQSFVKEVLRRSRTSCSTLQLALYYLHKSRRGIREAVSRAEASKGDIIRLEQELAECKRRAALAAAQVQTYPEDSYPSPPQSPNEHQRVDADARAHAVHASAVAAELGEQFSALVAAQNSPVLCGRRMFLAALISASKYLQDRNYSNRAWAKISGLPVGEINTNERAFLKVVDFQLHLPLEEFQRWTDRLAALASPVASPVESARPSPLGSSQYGLARSASTYATVSPDQSQLAAGVRANGPLTASARQALSRGQSAAAVLGSSVTPTREKGFPIATARAAPAPLMEYREVASPAAMSTASSSSTSSSGSSESGAGAAEAATAPKRQLRSLPVRRAGASQRTSTPSVALVPKPAQAAIYVPTSWSSGGSTPRSTASLGGPAGLREFGLEGLDLDGVRVH